MEFKRYFYTNYYVSETGVVKSIIKGKERILKPYISQGHYVVSISNKEVKVHRMIMICFRYRIDYIFLKVRHIDKNKLNNDISNLEWY